ncbi:MAG: hypothetical protein JW940_05015, partial [Polyangiaceae bacterium]|nr:hypothetical protein [Polyangiaceae bacterium]
MRREGDMMDRIVCWENLRRAYALALKGRRRPERPVPSPENVDRWLSRLAEQIALGTVEVGRLHQFVIHDPKRRVIHAPRFRERVLHHALMLVAGPVLERAAIADSYACRPGRGVHRARARAFEFSRRFDAHLKLDVRHYFDSISHTVLFRELERRSKDVLQEQDAELAPVRLEFGTPGNDSSGVSSVPAGLSKAPGEPPSG